MNYKLTFFLLTMLGLSTFNNVISLRTIDRINGIPRGWNDGDYIKDVHNDLDKFTGEWLYEDATRRFKLQIIKRVYIPQIPVISGLPASGQVYLDYLAVRYKYFENGNLIIDGYSNASGLASVFDLKNLIANISLPNSNSAVDSGYSVVEGIYNELSPTHICKNSQSSYLTLGYQTINNSVNGQITVGRLHWKRTEEDYTHGSQTWDGTPCDDGTYIIPEEMILIKQP